MKNTYLSSAVLVTLALLGAGCEPSVQRISDASPTNTQAATQTDAFTTSSTETATSTTLTDATPTSSATSTTATTTPVAAHPFKPIPMPKTFPGILSAKQVAKHVTIETTLGTIVIELLPEAGPRAASNFYTLAKAGFYDGTIFHRVIPGFMIQGGDPTGTGMGGPGYKFENDDVKNLPTKTITIQGRTLTMPVYEAGVVAMANAGRDTNGSQFFIMAADYPLPPDYSIFGRVLSGMDVVHAIENAQRNPQNDRPLADVSMTSVRVQE